MIDKPNIFVRLWKSIERILDQLGFTTYGG